MKNATPSPPRGRSAVNVGPASTSSDWTSSVANQRGRARSHPPHGGQQHDLGPGALTPDPICGPRGPHHGGLRPLRAWGRTRAAATCAGDVQDHAQRGGGAAVGVRNITVSRGSSAATVPADQDRVVLRAQPCAASRAAGPVIH